MCKCMQMTESGTSVKARAFYAKTTPGLFPDAYVAGLRRSGREPRVDPVTVAK